MQVISGIAVSPGVAIGEAFVIDSEGFRIPRRFIQHDAVEDELARLRLDLLHSPDFIPPFAGRFKRVITVHDLNFLYYPQFLTPDSRR